MATLKLRDRDAIITKEGLIFRVFGYSHPPSAYICDAEYAPAGIFTSTNPKALRSGGQQVFYKFYEDEGLGFIKKHYPAYYIFHDMLHQRVVGVNHSDILHVRKPKDRLRSLVRANPKDELVAALNRLLETLIPQCSRLSVEDFGVFGSILHNFHHPKFSDLDFTIYSGKKAAELRMELQNMYRDSQSPLTNEFETEESISGKRWRFQNYSPKEYVWHQQRKLIYAVYKDENSERRVKTEFEPVKDWDEIVNEYDSETRILQKGWVKMSAHVKEDSDSPFIPSIYEIEPLDVLHGARGAGEAVRIVSFMEEFRLQAFNDEKVYVEGNLEEVITSKGSFHQIVLTYCPRYYEQVLKAVV